MKARLTVYFLASLMIWTLIPRIGRAQALGISRPPTVGDADWIERQCSSIKESYQQPTFPISAPERPSSRLRVVNDQNLSTFQPRNKRFPSYFG